MKILSILFVATLPYICSAQSEENAVTSVVHQFFSGMKTGDGQLTEKCLHPDLRLASVVMDSEGNTRIIEENRDTLLLLIGTPHTETWDERISDIQVRIDGPLAVLTCNYEFYVGDRYSHKGIDVFELAKFGTEWKILSITDTRRR